MKSQKYNFLLITLLLISIPSEMMSINIFKKKKSKCEQSEQLFYIYKTRYNYSDLIPVVLNDSKSEILSMPTKEVLINNDGSINHPSQLSNGYLISHDFDFNKNIAFLDLTIEEYINSDKLPNAEEQIKYVKDFEPFRELYIFKCDKNKNPVEEVNRLITSNKIRELPTLILN